MHHAFVLILAVSAVLLPGTALLLSLGVRSLFSLAATAPAASIGVVATVGTVCGIADVRFGPIPVGIATAVLLAIGAVRWWTTRKPRPERHLSPSRVVGGAIVLLATGWGMVTWMRGLGSLATSPQEHDTIIHAVLVAYIERTGHSAPWQLLPVDVLSGAPSQFYPAGMHLLSAVVGDLTGDPVEGLNGITVALLTVGTTFSAAALTFVGARRAGMDVDRGVLAGGVAALVAVGLYRPVIALAVEGGALPQAAALVLTPGVVAALLTLRPRDRRSVVAVGIGCGGLIALHPSAVASIGVTLVAWWAGEALSRGGVRRVRRQLGVLAITGAVTFAIALPQLVASGSALRNTATTGSDMAPQKLSDALGMTLGMTFDGYLAHHRGTVQVAVLCLLVLGIAAMLLARKGFGALAAWTVWSVVSLAALVAPGSGPHSIVTAFFYHATLRTRGLPWLLVPVIAGIGVLLAVTAVVTFLRRHASARRHTRWVVAGLVLAISAGYAVTSAKTYGRINSDYLASRYTQPQFQRLSADDEQAATWLAGRVQPGERVLNSANDGSTLLYVRAGIPVVNVWSMGTSADPRTYQLLQRFRDYPTDRAVRRQLLDLNVRWVYVDAEAPAIVAGGSPENWVAETTGKTTYTVAPGLSALEGLPGLVPAFHSGSVTIYRFGLDHVSQGLVG